MQINTNQEKELVVALDIGTSKVCAIAGCKNEHGKLEILGVGKVESTGVMRGVVTNIEKTVKAISDAGCESAEKLIEVLEDEIIFVIGEWKLTRGDSLGDLNGMYSLIWQKKEGDWVITTDHSS